MANGVGIGENVATMALAALDKRKIKLLEQKLKAAIKSRVVEIAGLDSTILVMKYCIQEGIDRGVYSVYIEPARYERRFENGGLMDIENIKVTFNKRTMQYSVKNITKGNPGYKKHDSGYIEDIILSGHGYHYIKKTRPNEYLQPRDFYEVAQGLWEAEYHDVVAESIQYTIYTELPDMVSKIMSEIGG